MKSGPKPQHPTLKKLRGNPGQRKLNEDFPKPDPTRPACPRWLDKEAKAEWKRIVPALHEVGMITKVDRTALAGYCSAYSRWRRAEEALRDGFTYQYIDTGFKTKEAVKPEVKIAQESLKQVRMFCAEFGLTPSSRGRMQVPDLPKGEDEMEKLLGKKIAGGKN